MTKLLRTLKRAAEKFSPFFYPEWPFPESLMPLSDTKNKTLRAYRDMGTVPPFFTPQTHLLCVGLAALQG